MADGIRLMRAAVAQHAGSALGLRVDQPTGTVANQRTRGASNSDVYALPVDATSWEPLQVMDTASPNFSKFYFLPGYDVPGDTTKVIR